MLCQCEVFSLAIILFLLLALQSLFSVGFIPDSDSAREVADATGPDGSIELGVDANVFCEHVLASEVDDVSNRAGSLSLEGFLVNALVKVDGVVSRNFAHRVGFSLLLLAHFKYFFLISLFNQVKQKT